MASACTTGGSSYINYVNYKTGLTVTNASDAGRLLSSTALARRESLPRLKFRMPLRPGRAPGLRKKPRLEIDDVLRQCEWLARNAHRILSPRGHRPLRR